MKKELLSDNAEGFLERFNNLHDGLIRDIRIKYPRNSITPRITVVVEVRDWEAKNEEWVNIVLEIQNVTKFTLLQDKKRHLYAVILTFEAGFFNEKIYLDFAAGTPNLSPNLDYFEESPFLIVGERCFWYTTPYMEYKMD